MRFTSRVRDWLRRPRRRPVTPSSDGLLREFVYLDEVSVYSILASRKGAIPIEFTENQTEPPRVCRRPFCLSHAAMSDCSSMA